jgi:hypothetical protein
MAMACDVSPTTQNYYHKLEAVELLLQAYPEAAFIDTTDRSIQILLLGPPVVNLQLPTRAATTSAGATTDHAPSSIPDEGNRLNEEVAGDGDNNNHHHHHEATSSARIVRILSTDSSAGELFQSTEAMVLSTTWNPYAWSLRAADEEVRL